MKHNPFIIGLVGLPGAGKTTVTEFLEKHGFVRVILSDIIRDELKKRGVTDITREILQDVGNEMRRMYGPDVLAKRAIKQLRSMGGDKFVIDGIRNVSEIAYLKKQNHLLLIGIQVAARVRFMRLKRRKLNPLTNSYHEFLLQARRENTLGAHTTGLRVIDCLRACTVTITNDSTVAAFKKKLHDLLVQHTML